MTLKHPFMISSRLLPAVRVGNGTISIQFERWDGFGRAVLRYFIDADGKTHESNDLHSGVGFYTLQSAMGSLLSFLGAAAESYRYAMAHPGRGENLDMFPDWVNEWAYQNSDEISMLQLEIDETPNLIEA